MIVFCLNVTLIDCTLRGQNNSNENVSNAFKNGISFQVIFVLVYLILLSHEVALYTCKLFSRHLYVYKLRKVDANACFTLGFCQIIGNLFYNFKHHFNLLVRIISRWFWLVFSFLAYYSNVTWLFISISDTIYCYIPHPFYDIF